MNRRVALTAAVMLLAGCAPASKETAPLGDDTWRLVEIGGNAVRVEAAQQPTLTLIDDDARAEGSGGCNRYSATFEQDGTALGFGPAMATKRGCAEAVNRLEVQFFDALTRVAAQRVEDGELQLLDVDGAVLMRLRR
jgi:heat shock protein HslJ